jgi:hypothetical protein
LIFKIEFAALTKWVTRYISTIFDDKHITPLDFRRILTSIIFDKEIHEEGKTVNDFLVSYSNLINTSQKVNIFNFFKINKL